MSEETPKKSKKIFTGKNVLKVLGAAALVAAAFLIAYAITTFIVV